MSQKIPKTDSADLDAKQIVALESLLKGTTATAAAKAAGVSRRTVWRWQRSDTAFQAALNMARREIREAAEIRLTRLADVAIGLVEKSVEAGDVRTALAVLRGLHLLGGVTSEIGSDDPEELALWARAKAAERAEAAMLAELTFAGGR